MNIFAKLKKPVYYSMSNQNRNLYSAKSNKYHIRASCRTRTTFLQREHKSTEAILLYLNNSP